MRRKVGAICIAVGAVLLIAALSLMAYNKWDDWRAGQAVVSIQEMLKSQQESALLTQPFYDYDGTLTSEDSEDLVIEEQTIEIDGYEYIGTLSIPRFGLELPVMASWSYPGLKLSPCRYVGTVYTRDLVICGHNYERHFGNLKYLDPGDTVTFTDVLGNVFSFEVVEVLILQPTAVEDMITGDWDLTLFTCTVGGQARVTVRCMRTSEP